LHGYFEHSGFAVLEAGSGAEALRVVKAGDVDAVVSDVLMPEVSGAVFCDSPVSRVPELMHRVVLLTRAAREPKVQAPIEQRGVPPIQARRFLSRG
jgi:CheY-like chemotaxis protein